MHRFLILLAIFVLLSGWSVVDSFLSAENDADVVGDFGTPIAGLSPLQLARFELGRTMFERTFRRLDGLGPHFNADSCASCHEDPTTGGSSQRYRDFFLAGNTNGDGLTQLYPECTVDNAPMARTDLCLPSLVIPHFGPKGSIQNPTDADVEHPSIPTDTTVVARRNAPPIFGVGLFRLVSDSEILSRNDPFDIDGDGISGRVNLIASEGNAIGRFGFKCQTASIEAFNRGALNNQMGITSDSIAIQVGDAGTSSESRWIAELLETKTAHAQVAEPRDRIVDFDGVLDPEISRTELIALVFFQENLAAPRRGRITPSVRLGEQIFEDIGCAACHVPTLATSIGCIHPYTDLLIHDMGPDLDDGVPMADAAGSEFRTQPLWGLCEHPPFLHDGSADTVSEAILRHGGEAAAAAASYADLSDNDRRYLHRFLESL